ncbi:DNA polymerase IV [Patescibacteria group bacterium]|nr:DNA polymerase IV [Patescibacteria group bacterium]
MEFRRSQRLLVHLDMNSFFAAVEQQARPDLRGRPLGVCAYLHEQGCIIAASREAKRVGMKVGMRVHEARAVAPDAVFIQNDPAKYRSVISRVFALLHEITDTIEYYSIDEAFLDLTGWYRDAAEAAFIMRRIQERITSEVGEWLTCSVGIAPTRLLAKLASDMQKPYGLTVLTPEELRIRAPRLALQDICGIGRRMERRFQRQHIHTVLELLDASPGKILRAFGKQGYVLWSELSGYEGPRIASVHETSPHSIGHSYCVPERVNREGLIVPTLLRLLERAVQRMRRLQLRATGMVVVIGVASENVHQYGWGSWYRDVDSRVKHFPEPLFDSFSLSEIALQLLRDGWDGKRSVTFLAVTLLGLTVPSMQIRLEEGEDSWRDRDDRRVRMSRAMDTIRDRYGLEAIQFGSMVALSGEEAPDRIGFRKTEGIDVPQSFS